MTPSGDGTRISFMGRLRVVRHAEHVDADLLRGAQPRAVLARLVLSDERRVPADRLAGALWGPDRPRTWRPALRGVIAKLREFLEQQVDPSATLCSEPEGYELALPPPVETDVERARRAIVGAEMALERGYRDILHQEATTAERLTRHVFLPGVATPWTDEMRDELRTLRLRSLHAIAESHLLRGQPIRAARTADEAIAFRPHYERSYRLAMRAHAAAGEPALATRTFERCRVLLREEFGLEPSPHTIELHTAILRGQVA